MNYVLKVPDSLNVILEENQKTIVIFTTFMP